MTFSSQGGRARFFSCCQCTSIGTFQFIFTFTFTFPCYLGRSMSRQPPAVRAKVMTLARDGMPKWKIMQETGCERRLVKRWASRAGDDANFSMADLPRSGRRRKLVKSEVGRITRGKRRKSSRVVAAGGRSNQNS